jgi:hypothetical protein
MSPRFFPQRCELRRDRVRRRISGTVGLILFVTALGIGASACSSSNPQARADTTTSRPTSTTGSSSPGSTVTTTTAPAVAGYVTIRGKKVAVPYEQDHRQVQKVEDVGEEILITPAGFEPHLLFAETGMTVVFTNLTPVAQRLRFPAESNFSSPLIAPGATWRYRPKYGISYYYVNQKGQNASFVVSPPGAP